MENISEYLKRAKLLASSPEGSVMVFLFVFFSGFTAIYWISSRAVSPVIRPHLQQSTLKKNISTAFRKTLENKASTQISLPTPKLTQPLSNEDSHSQKNSFEQPAKVTVLSDRATPFFVSFPSKYATLTPESKHGVERYVYWMDLQTDLHKNWGSVGLNGGEQVFHVGPKLVSVGPQEEINDKYFGSFSVRVTYE